MLYVLLSVIVWSYMYLILVLMILSLIFFFSSRRRHTRCALVTGVQTCALPIWLRVEPSFAGRLNTSPRAVISARLPLGEMPMLSMLAATDFHSGCNCGRSGVICTGNGYTSPLPRSSCLSAPPTSYTPVPSCPDALRISHCVSWLGPGVRGVSGSERSRLK